MDRTTAMLGDIPYNYVYYIHLQPELRLQARVGIPQNWSGNWFGFVRRKGYIPCSDTPKVSNIKLGFPLMGVAPNHPFIDEFSHIDHPAIGVPLFVEAPSWTNIPVTSPCDQPVSHPSVVSLTLEMRFATGLEGCLKILTDHLGVSENRHTQPYSHLIRKRMIHDWV